MKENSTFLHVSVHNYCLLAEFNINKRFGTFYVYLLSSNLNSLHVDQNHITTLKAHFGLSALILNTLGVGSEFNLIISTYTSKNGDDSVLSRVFSLDQTFSPSTFVKIICCIHSSLV